MSDKIKHIKRNIKIPKVRLWFIWFFLFVFPCIIALFGFEIFSKKYAYFFKTDLINKAFENINKYNETIIPENFLEKQLKAIQSLNTSLPFEILKNEIDKEMCGESLFCLFFDENVEKISILKSNNASNDIKNLPVYFFKKHIKNIIEKELELGSKKEDLINAYETDEQFSFLLQQLFKTATNITIHLNKVSKNFSVKYDGELYFIFCKFNKPSKNCMGFFAVIQGKYFNFHKMLEKLNTDFSQIKIVFKEFDINETEKKPEIFHSGIRKDKEGLHIIAPASAKFIRHVLHSGSASLNQKYGKFFPFIDYYIPIWRYWENVNNRMNIIRQIALLIMLISSIYFLKVSLFGFNNKISFKYKILCFLLIAAIFPFGMFSMGLYSRFKTEKYINKYQVQNHVETLFELTSQELDDFKSKLEANLENSAQELSRLISDNNNNNNNDNEIIKYFNKIGEENPISTAILYFNPPPEKIKNFFTDNKLAIDYPDRISKFQGNYKNDVLTKKYLELTLKFASEEKPSSREAENKLEILGQKLDSEMLNDFLKNNGKILSINKAPTVYYFTLNYIYDYTKNSNVIGLLTTNLEPKPILEKFLRHKYSSLAKEAYNERIGTYNIDYAFIPLENSGNTSIWDGSGTIDAEDKKICLQNPVSGIVENKNKILIKRRNQFIPHLVVATIREIDGYNETSFIITVLAGIIAYLSLILYFSNILLDILIVNPVLLLASNASAIAKGSDKWEAEINSGDEFEDLNNDFKLLVTGLQERNILKSYVSEDAFSDIEGTDSLKLLPSGEYLEATIVFSAIKDYDKLSSSITPQESIKLLSNFMSIAEKVAKEYQGSIDKIIGNTIMLVFRNNPNNNFHAFNAAKASLKLVEEAKSIGLPRLYTGISSGRVISGRIGSYSGRLDFTVIGNPVNMAARLKTEAQNGSEETGIIISEEIIELLGNNIEARFLRRVSIKGKSNKYNIFELLNIKK